MTTKEAIKEAIADIKHSVNWAKENDERWCDSIEVGSLELAIKVLELVQQLLDAGYKNATVDFYIGGRLFRAKEIAQ